MRNHQASTKILKATQGVNFLHIAQTAISENSNGPEPFHGSRHDLASMTGVQAIVAKKPLPKHTSIQEGVFEQSQAAAELPKRKY